MTAVLPSPSHLPSSPSSSPLLSCTTTTTTTNDGTHQTLTLLRADPSRENDRRQRLGTSGGDLRSGKERSDQQEQNQLSLLALFVTIFRKSWVGCSVDRGEDLGVMEIGWPTNVRHVAHVTFDRFHGFLGLPVEFEPEVPRRAPSASASVFGVSAESMQCSFDNRGNSVPTILLLMQRRLYSQGGLQAEGIFRINAENSQEEYLRDQLNSGIVSDGIDVHCLAGLIKAWFRELPTGVLDSLTTEQVMQCHSEEECALLVKLLPPTEAALLDWAINLMADVAQEEHHNKMNARNIAMVFAPNMTQMADPLTALMYAVQVMNFLKTLIERELKDRQDAPIPTVSSLQLDPSNENGHQSPSQLCSNLSLEAETEDAFTYAEPILDDPSDIPPVSSFDDNMASSTTQDNTSDETGLSTGDQPCQVPNQEDFFPSELEYIPVRRREVNHRSSRRTRAAQSSNARKWPKSVGNLPAPLVPEPTEKPKGISLVTRINSRAERVEAWR